MRGTESTRSRFSVRAEAPPTQPFVRLRPTSPPPPAELIRGIKDPEHPHTLEELKVAQRDLIEVDDARGLIKVRFTPTIPHCSMATLIGLCIRVRLLRSLPRRLKLDIEITPGTHASETSINKQLNDKERVAAALENHNLLKVVNECLSYREPGIDAR